MDFVVQKAVVDHPLGTFLVLSTFLGLALIFRFSNHDDRRLRDFPLLQMGSEKSRAQRIAMYNGATREMYEKGYKEFPEQLHRITTQDGDHVVVPSKYIEELKNRPDREISVLGALIRIFESKYTKFYPPQEDFQLLIATIKVELTRKLTSINSQLSADVTATIRATLPAATEWTPINAYPLMLQVVAVITGSVFVGPELCHHPAYTRAAMDYTVDVFLAGAELKACPAVLKPFVSWFGSKGARVRAHRRDMTAFLAPIVAERKRLLAAGAALPEDALTWIIRLAEERGMTDVSHVVEVVLHLIVASVHTTTSFVTRLLHDLAAKPEVVDEMREEIRGVLASNEGEMTPQALFDMRFTDSVMKECLRLSPPLIATFIRRTEQPITLKDGTLIPAHTLLSGSTAYLRDPALYPEPDRFDPHRFHRLRSDAAGAQWQFTSTTREHMVFGIGRHACPGRFFAANEIKLILARVLLEYDVTMPPGEVDPYPSMCAGIQLMPEMRKEVLIRRVAKRD